MTTITTKYPFVGSVETRQGGRNENQDNAGFVDTPLGLLIVVCDGMGGGPGGRTASLIGVDTILTQLADISQLTPRTDALKYAIEKANDLIYAKAKDTPELMGMGTTVAAILLNEDSALIAHAGDSRIYQLRKGKVVFRSSDHSLVANYVRQNKITEEEARNHPRSNIVTRAMGVRPNIEIEFDEVSFHRGDRFVVCTDGVWGALPQRDLIDLLSRMMGIAELTALITDEIDNIGSTNGGGHDNMTIAIVDATFDSVKKNIKIYPTVISSKRKLVYKCIILLFILVCLTFVYSLLIRNKIYEKHNENAKMTMQGRIETTVTHDHPALVVDKSIQNEQIAPNTQIDNGSRSGNPFQNDSIKEKEEIANLIKEIVKNLDSLKSIKGKKQKVVQEEKRTFIRKYIKPSVINLSNKVDGVKKDKVTDVLNLLDDRKSLSCTQKGEATKEGEEYIEKIKTKVYSLMN